MTRNFFEHYKDLKDKEQIVQNLREEIATQLNPIIKALFANNKNYRTQLLSTSSDYELRITKRILDKDTYHFLANVEVFDIWETQNEHEYAMNWVIPTYVLTDKNYAERYEHQQATWKEAQKQREINSKAQQKATKERQDMNTYRRIARKLRKKI